MVSATLAVTPKTLHYPFFYCHCIINFTLKPWSLLALGGSPHLMCTTCTALLRCNNWGNSLQVWVFSHSFDNTLQHSVSKGYELQDLILICNFETFQETGIHYQIFGQFRKWICEHKSNKNKMHLNCHFFKTKNLKTKPLNMLEVIGCSCFPSKTASFA